MPKFAGIGTRTGTTLRNGLRTHTGNVWPALYEQLEMQCTKLKRARQRTEALLDLNKKVKLLCAELFKSVHLFRVTFFDHASSFPTLYFEQAGLPGQTRPIFQISR